MSTVSPPLVSVVIPSHNRADYIVAAVRSVLQQRCADDIGVEVVVVDDASTDGTPGVLADAFGDDITVLVNPRNIERGACRNLGARTARGRYVAFLDSDDLWSPEKLTRQLEEARERVLVLTDVFLIDADGRPTGELRRPSESDQDVRFRNPFFGSPSSMLLDRSTFLACGGFPEEPAVQGAEDWIFLNLLRAHDVRFTVVPEPLVGYRVHGANDTGDPTRVAQAYDGALRWMADHDVLRGEELDAARSACAVSLARQFAVGGRADEARRWARAAGRSGGPGTRLRAEAYVLGHLAVRAWRSR